MAVTYFGLVTSDGTITGDNTDDNTGTSAVAYWNGTQVWTCPGTGNQTVKEISVYAKYKGASNVLIGIYSEDGLTKIAEGTAQVAVVGASYSWQGHMTQASITPNPVNLVGGTNYKIFAAADGDHYMRAKSGASGIGRYKLTDYTAGLPAAIPTSSANTLVQALRVGVEAAAGGGNPWYHNAQQ